MPRAALGGGAAACALSGLFLCFVFYELIRTYGVCGGALWWYAAARAALGGAAVAVLFMLVSVKPDTPPPPGCGVYLYALTATRCVSLLLGSALTLGAMRDRGCRDAMAAAAFTRTPLLGLCCICLLADDAWCVCCALVYLARRKPEEPKDAGDDDETAVIIIDLQRRDGAGDSTADEDRRP